MLGLFKRMLSRPELAPTPPAAVPMKPAVPARPGPAAKPTVPATPTRTGVPASPVRVAPIVSKIAPVAASNSLQPRSAPTSSATETQVQVALVAIAASLPEAISHKVPANPEQFVSVPVDKILAQLAHGQVVLTVSELLECAPDYFAALAGHEEVPVTLPLGDIVKQLSSEHFARRNQRRVEVPEEVISVFASGGKGLTVSKPAPPSPAPRAQPTGAAAAAAAPAQPIAAAAPAAKIAMSPQAVAALGGKPASTVAPAGPRATTVSPKIATPRAAVTPVGSAARDTSTPLPKKVSSGTVKKSGELAVPLGSVCKDWVDEVRAQLAEVDIAQSQILAPLELLEPAMKSGKVVFSWHEVAAWIQPPLSIPPTVKVGEMAVEIPLKVLAPLFMAHHRGATQQRVAVDEAIPDLFGGSSGKTPSPSQIPVTPAAPPAPAATSVRAPSAPAPARTSVPPAAAIPANPALRKAVLAATPLPKTDAKTAASVPVNSPPGVTIEQIIGSEGKRFAAKEIVANAARLPGVAGSLLAMSDGLLVTSQTPPQTKTETIAAFLPQMFGRMNQYTKELALGALEHLTLGVESGQWHVVKAPNIYFAVLGKHGETLPLNLLAQVAAELSSQSQ